LRLLFKAELMGQPAAYRDALLHAVRLAVNETSAPAGFRDALNIAQDAVTTCIKLAQWCQQFVRDQQSPSVDDLQRLGSCYLQLRDSLMNAREQGVELGRVWAELYQGAGGTIGGFVNASPLVGHRELFDVALAVSDAIAVSIGVEPGYSGLLRVPPPPPELAARLLGPVLTAKELTPKPEQLAKLAGEKETMETLLRGIAEWIESNRELSDTWEQTHKPEHLANLLTEHYPAVRRRVVELPFLDLKEAYIKLATAHDAAVKEWTERKAAAVAVGPGSKAGRASQANLANPDGPAATDALLEQWVTLDKMAAIVSRSKRTLEKLKNRQPNPLPIPDAEGGGGRPDEWKWSNIRPWLEKEYDKSLPDRYPADRFHDARADRS